LIGEDLPGMDRPGRHAIGLSKSSDGDTPVIGDLGDDISDESRISDSSFTVEDPLIGLRFPLLHFMNILIKLRFLQGIVPVDPFYRFFNFLEQFPSDNESANEISDRWYDVFRRG
jgi:hypothetical protein